MDFGDPGFIMAIVAICTGGWLVNNWIRAKHGYPLEDEWGGKTEPVASTQQLAQNAALAEQNRKLLETVERMQDRLIVLERIVTDKGYTVAAEIEALRDTPRTGDSGVPLNLAKKERAQ